jgi:hypothetical protein
VLYQGESANTDCEAIRDKKRSVSWGCFHSVASGHRSTYIVPVQEPSPIVTALMMTLSRYAALSLENRALTMSAPGNKTYNPAAEFPSACRPVKRDTRPAHKVTVIAATKWSKLLLKCASAMAHETVYASTPCKHISGRST